MAVSQRDTAEFEPRRRIIGAIILVTLAFVVFSLVLQDKPVEPGTAKPEQEPDTQVVVAPVPSPSATASRPAASPDSPATTEPTAVTPTKPVPPPAPTASVPKPEPKPATQPKTEAAKPAPAPVATGNWLVQVGTFSEPENARRLGEKLKGIHYPVRLKVVTLDKGRAVRVQAGPFATKASAVAARDDIEKRLGLRGVIRVRK
ncbi:MAG: SPOR domain-containing protein [Acidiferrobacteraceae bacterium]|jgi:DedD protein